MCGLAAEYLARSSRAHFVGLHINHNLAPRLALLVGFDGPEFLGSGAIGALSALALVQGSKSKLTEGTRSQSRGVDFDGVISRCFACFGLEHDDEVGFVVCGKRVRSCTSNRFRQPTPDFFQRPARDLAVTHDNLKRSILGVAFGDAFERNRVLVEGHVQGFGVFREDGDLVVDDFVDLETLRAIWKPLLGIE